MYGQERSYMKHCSRYRSLLHTGQHPGEGGTVAWRDGAGELVLYALHRARACCRALLPEARDRGAYAAAIRRIIDTAHQAIGLEAIDELRHVGSDAALARGELTQRQRLAGGGELGDHAVLRHGQSDLAQRALEPMLERVRRLEEGEHHRVGFAGGTVHGCTKRAVEGAVKSGKMRNEE